MMVGLDPYSGSRSPRSDRINDVCIKVDIKPLVHVKLHTNFDTAFSTFWKALINTFDSKLAQIG